MHFLKEDTYNNFLYKLDEQDENMENKWKNKLDSLKNKQTEYKNKLENMKFVIN